MRLAKRLWKRNIFWETRVSRLFIWLLTIIVALVIIGSLVLLFVDVPYAPTRVEQPVSNETLGL